MSKSSSPGLVRIAAATFLMGVLSVVSPRASALLIYQLDVCNAGSDLCAASLGPYGTVTVSLIGQTIHVAVDASPGFGFFGMGGMFGFNVVDPDAGVAVSNTVSIPSGGVGAFSMNQQYDGFGRFEFSLDGPPASKSLTNFSFDVTRTGGFSDQNQLEELSTGGAGNGTRFFAAHVIDTMVGTGQGATGFAAPSRGAGPPQQAPEPGSLTLLGLALAALAGWRRARPD